MFTSPESADPQQQAPATAIAAFRRAECSSSLRTFAKIGLAHTRPRTRTRTRVEVPTLATFGWIGVAADRFGQGAALRSSQGRAGGGC